MGRHLTHSPWTPPLTPILAILFRRCPPKMRLLNTTTLLVETFPGPELTGCPPYSIVSHTWGQAEVSLDEVQAPTPAIRRKAGYRKVQTCAAKAKSDGYKYVWIDTCWRVPAVEEFAFPS